MKLGHLFVFVAAFVISHFSFADNNDWLAPYLQSKSFQCVMSIDQLKAQIAVQIDRNIGLLTESLVQRGSDFQNIAQRRDTVEIGVFPKLRGYDFYVLENVTVTMGKFQFPIQTTYFFDGVPNVQKGLWFPLKVKDPGPNKICQLDRISVRDGQQNARPEVDLVLGDPPRVIVSRLIEVIDVSSEPEPPVSTQPNTSSKEPEKKNVEKKELEKKNVDKKDAEKRDVEKKEVKKKAEEKPKQSETRRERRERRRRERRERREERRHRRHRHYRSYQRSNIEEPARKPVEPPDKPNDCNGDLSPWKTMTCTITGLTGLGTK